LDLILTPNLQTFLWTNNAGITTTPNWSFDGAANFTALTSQIDMGRVVGMGLRVYPQVALTAAPGLIYSGVVPRCSLGEFAAQMALTTNNRANLPYNQFFLGRTGNTECNQICWRPTDISEFVFHDVDAAFASVTAGVVTVPTAAALVASSDLDTGGSFCQLSLTGLPSSTPVYVECIIHLECTSSSKTIANDTASDSSPMVCDDRSLSSIESAYRLLQKWLPSPSQAIEAFDRFTNSQVAQAALKYARGYENRRNGFVMLT
jgi:hypothetical protein